MRDNYAKIKNLAIAYEALSRCAGAEEFLSSVNDLLGKELREAETKPYVAQNQDDEIPF